MKHASGDSRKPRTVIPEPYRIGYTRRERRLVRAIKGPKPDLYLGADGEIHRTTPGRYDGSFRPTRDRWGRTWQAEWEGCTRAVRGYTRAGVMLKALRAIEKRGLW